jgi:Na+/proline symporter
MSWVLVSFVGFLAFFAAVGTLSIRRKRSVVDDYLLASRSVHPWLIGLSSVVTNNSGYMFIGLIGFTYSEGLSAIWLTVGWILGDLVAWYVVHPRLRAISETSPAETVGALIAEPFGRHARLIAVLLGIVSILFLATYAAAQLNAGSKALYVIFNWNIEVGALLGAGIVLL